MVDDVPGHNWASSADDRGALRTALMQEWATLSSDVHQRVWRSPSGDWLRVRVHGTGARALVVLEEDLNGPPWGLTDQEMTIVAKVAEGKSNKQLASGLGISVRTVAKHMENILAKSGSESRTELCSRVHHEGFISVRPPAARV